MRMALHRLKLCVGVTEVAELQRWVKGQRAGRDTINHTTRMFPKRREEILEGGSLYWVIRGMILCRQRRQRQDQRQCARDQGKFRHRFS